jgi:hypothetical protein
MTKTISTPASGPTSNISQTLSLRAGEWVEVRSEEEILATLDTKQCLEGLPFMPEMLHYCGKRFRVHKSAHKTCDTIELYTIRRMENAVHLEGLRCNGEAHGGCQAGCLLFWKHAWLKPVTSGVPEFDAAATAPSMAEASKAIGIARLHDATRAQSVDGHECFRCQTTELLHATAEVRRRDKWNPKFYLKDLTSGNVGLRNFFWYGLIAVLNAFSLHWFGRRYPRLQGLAGDKTPHVSLNLQPGDWVRVRSKDEIMETLNSQQRNRGLFFDVEMTPFCGGHFQVLKRVEKIIDEKTGRMLKMPNSCLILDGVTCGGCMSSNRMFCPRGIYPYWREAWLQRAEKTDESTLSAVTVRASRMSTHCDKG